MQAKVWSPKLAFTNAKIIGGTLVDDTTTTVIARKCLCPAPDDVRMAVESNVYEGIKSNILQKREYFMIGRAITISSFTPSTPRCAR